MLLKDDLQQKLDPLERLALLIASLCHDLDHRGTNNRFEDLKKSKLHTLYVFPSGLSQYDNGVDVSDNNDDVDGDADGSGGGCCGGDDDDRGCSTQDAFSIRFSRYGTSTMECHHFDMCVTIMETNNNNILINLGVDQYATVIAHIKKAILATDIATYLKVCGHIGPLMPSAVLSVFIDLVSSHIHMHTYI